MEVDVERSSLFIENKKECDKAQCIPCANTKKLEKLKTFFDKNDFFEFKRFIFRKYFLTSEVRQVLEYILMSQDDKSAAYVSLIWERFQLWESKTFLTTEDDNGRLLMHYVINSQNNFKPYNIRSLFSFLMFDWHDTNRKNEGIKHYLYEKSKQYKQQAKKSLFSILYEIIATKKYQNICLHIIYQFLHELYTDKENDALQELPEIMEIGKIIKKDETTTILKRDDLDDFDYIKKISKVFVTYWHKLDNDYSLHKNDSLSISSFFKLAFMLKERKNSTFEMDFQEYIENCKKKYGFYYETKLKGDNRLLLHITQENELTQVKSFIFRICPFNEINASPITNLQDISKLMTLNIYPWNKEERNILHDLRKTFEEIQKINEKYYRNSQIESFAAIREIKLGGYFHIPSDQKEDQNEEHRQLIDDQLNLFRRHLSRTNNNYNNRLTKLFGSFKTSRNLLFERECENDSLFEEILQKRGMKELIELMWDTCDILKDDNILQTRNLNGHHLLDYVIDSNDDANLIGFIIPNHSNKISLLNRRHLVQIQNEQHIFKTGINLFERFMCITHKDLRDRFYEITFCLLEELDQICDIEKKTEIDILLLFLDVKKNKMKIMEKIMEKMKTIMEGKFKHIKLNPEKNLTCDNEFNQLLQVLFDSKIDIIRDKDKQTEINKLLSSLLLSLNDENKKVLKNQMMKWMKVQYIIDKIIVDSKAKFEYEYDFNKLLRYSLKYWTPSNDNTKFLEYKNQLLSTGDPIFEMIIQIIEGEEDEFKKRFFENVQDLFFYYKNRYNAEVLKKGLIQEDMFFLFRVAIKHGRNNIIECILSYEHFETLKFEFPRHNRANKHNLFVAGKLLNYGYELSHEGLPPYWITEQVLEDFLNSCITHYDENLIRLDMSFLMKSKYRKYKINGKDDVNDYFLFNEHTANLEYILENEHVKSLLQHPIVSTYINIKTHKYKFIHEVNFYFFLLAFMLPFGCLISLHTSDSNVFSLRSLQVTCVTSTTIVCIREIFQFKWFYESRNQYFSQLSNQIELLLIVLSWLLLTAIFALDIPDSLDMFSFLATFFIIVATIVMMSMVPFDVVPLYMRMLKNVSITFLKFFSFFVFIVFAFSVSFYIIFRPLYLEGDAISLKSISSTNQRNGNDDDEAVYKNFGTLVASFFKTLLMLSGEYTIEPFTLSLTKMIIFFIFVITSFILFNLIIALAITDVKELTDEAEALDLCYKSQKLIISAGKWKQFYRFLRLNNKDNGEPLSCIQQVYNFLLSYIQHKTVQVFKFILFKHCYLHKLDVVFVNLKTLEVTIKIKKRYKSPLLTNFGWRQKYKMDPRTFESVKQILKQRDDAEYRDLKKEISQVNMSPDFTVISPVGN